MLTAPSELDFLVIPAPQSMPPTPAPASSSIGQGGRRLCEARDEEPRRPDPDGTFYREYEESAHRARRFFWALAATLRPGREWFRSGHPPEQTERVSANPESGWWGG